MSDNVPLPAAAGNAACDEVTYSGDTAFVQLVRCVLVTGSEGSKTVVELTGDNSNGLDVDVTRLPALVAGTANIGDVDVLTVPADPFGVNADAASATGSISAKLRFIAATGIPITGDALTALQLLDDTVLADDAAFNVGSSKVTMAGMMAVPHGSAPDPADSFDAVVPLANRHRVQFTIGGHPNIVSYTHAAITTAVTNTALITTSAGSKIVVTAITVTLDNASTVFPSVRIGFGTASVPALGNAGIILAHGGVPAGGGVNRGDGSGIIGIGGDDEDLRITTVGNATGNGLQVTVNYYVIDS